VLKKDRKFGSGEDTKEKADMLKKSITSANIESRLMTETLLSPSFPQFLDGHPLFLKHGCPIEVLGHDSMRLEVAGVCLRYSYANE
jgi:hypothetical protein